MVMIDKIVKRIENVVEFLTSKKVAVAALASLLIVWVVKTTPAIVAIAAIAAAYIIGQAYVDSRK
jgi:hypothetical protein